jgi:hypothetical protein
MKCSYEFIVFNDAKDFPDYSNNFCKNIKNEIQDICDILNIKCINIPNNKHRTIQDKSVRTADSCNYILDYQVSNPGKYLVLDSNIFLIRDFYGNEYDNYDCAVILKSEYFWYGMYYFDTRKMKDMQLLTWDCLSGYNDAGGAMKYWLKNQDKSKIYLIKGFKRVDVFYKILDNKFFYVRDKGNWIFKKLFIKKLENKLCLKSNI